MSRRTDPTAPLISEPHRTLADCAPNVLGILVLLIYVLDRLRSGVVRVFFITVIVLLVIVFAMGYFSHPMM